MENKSAIQSCLHLVCELQNYENVEQHLKHGGKIDAECMHIACRESNIAVVRLLLENGGQVDAECMHIICRKKFFGLKSTYITMIELLLKNGGQVDAECMHNVCLRGCVRIAELLLQNGGCVDAECVRYVCGRGCPVLLKFLLDNKGPIDERCMHILLKNMQNKRTEQINNNTYIGNWYERKKNYINTASLLLKYGCPVTKEFHKSLPELNYGCDIMDLTSYKISFLLTQRTFVLAEKAHITNFKKDPYANCHFWWRLCLLPDELVGIVLASVSTLLHFH